MSDSSSITSPGGSPNTSSTSLEESDILSSANNRQTMSSHVLPTAMDSMDNVLNPFNNALGPKPTKPTKERDMKPFVALPKISKLGSKEKNALEEKNNTNLSMYLSVCKLCTNLYTSASSIHDQASEALKRGARALDQERKTVQTLRTANERLKSDRDTAERKAERLEGEKKMDAKLLDMTETSLKEARKKVEQLEKEISALKKKNGDLSANQGRDVVAEHAAKKKLDLQAFNERKKIEANHKKKKDATQKQKKRDRLGAIEKGGGGYDFDLELVSIPILLSYIDSVFSICICYLLLHSRKKNTMIILLASPNIVDVVVVVRRAPGRARARVGARAVVHPPRRVVVVPLLRARVAAAAAAVVVKAPRAVKARQAAPLLSPIVRITRNRRVRRARIRERRRRIRRRRRIQRRSVGRMVPLPRRATG